MIDSCRAIEGAPVALEEEDDTETAMASAAAVAVTVAAVPSDKLALSVFVRMVSGSVVAARAAASGVLGAKRRVQTIRDVETNSN